MIDIKNQKEINKMFGEVFDILDKEEEDLNKKEIRK